MIRIALVFTLLFSNLSFAYANPTDTTRSESNVVTFKKSNYSFVVAWKVAPKKGETSFFMRTWKNDVGTMNGPFQDLEKNLHIFLWMPTMGHGSAPVKIQKTAEGEYDVTNVQFIMGGKWDIKFQLKDGNQVVDEAVVSLSI